MQFLYLSTGKQDLNLLTIYAVYLIAISLFTFLSYGADKLKAKKGAYRISEKTLLGLSLLGGGFGGLIGMKVFRHKTTGKHWYFTLINIIAILIHSAVFYYLAFIK